MNPAIRPFPLFRGRKSPLPRPLTWVIRRARRIERFFACSRREAIREAAIDYQAFMGHRPFISALKGAQRASTSTH